MNKKKKNESYEERKERSRRDMSPYMRAHCARLDKMDDDEYRLHLRGVVDQWPKVNGEDLKMEELAEKLVTLRRTFRKFNDLKEETNE